MFFVICNIVEKKIYFEFILYLLCIFFVFSGFGGWFSNRDFCSCFCVNLYGVLLLSAEVVRFVRISFVED